jgi:Endonuclease-reverse transcriptase
MLIILGDFNAMLLKSNFAKFTENRNSDTLQDFLYAFDLTPINLKFKHKRQKPQPTFYGMRNRKATLDYILVRNKWSSSFSNCKVKICNTSSDHCMVIVTISWTLKNNKCVIKKKKELVAILTNSTVRDNIVSHISNRNISAFSYSSFSACVTESIDLYVPDAQLRKSWVPWEDEDIVNLRKIKRDSQLQYMSLPSTEIKKSYYDLCKKFSDLYVQKQEDFLEQCDEGIMKLNDADH